jgi:Ni,Fe-hydrogenase III small subunit
LALKIWVELETSFAARQKGFRKPIESVRSPVTFVIAGCAPQQRTIMSGISIIPVLSQHLQAAQVSINESNLIADVCLSNEAMVP